MILTPKLAKLREIAERAESFDGHTQVVLMPSKVALELLACVEALEFCRCAIDNNAKLRGVTASMAVSGMRANEALERLERVLG